MSFIQLYKLENSGCITCYNIQTTDNFNDHDLNHIKQLLQPNIESIDNRYNYTEVGPHLHTTTPWSSNCQSIVEKMGIKNIVRIEKTTLILNFDIATLDPLIETIYKQPLTEFSNQPDSNQTDSNQIHNTNDFYQVDDIDEENKNMNLGFDSFDLEYYKKLFEELGKKPTNIELHDLSQSNSEHARHWFFKGKLENKSDKSLFQMVKDTQKYANDKSLVAFHDNSSVFKGYDVDVFYPNYDDHKFSIDRRKYHFTFTSETHNFPTSICPFQGATTGTGGRIRDNQCVGRGGHVVSGIAGYCVGEIEPLKSEYYKKNLKTLIEASDGASDYGNKFGEPVILGFTRVFEINVNNNHIGWIKPIMFTGGVGQIDDHHVVKKPPKKNMFVIKIGGPAFRIGFGGGAASSRDQNTIHHNDDMNAVQRGDPEMENRMNRLIKTCIELGNMNPIQSINDQGAGGTANATKEIVYPNGADIFLGNIIKSDSSMSALELWISEYQENNTVLIDKKDLGLINQIAKRENVPISIIGQITNSGNIRVYDGDKLVMNMPLEPIVGDMPRKFYTMEKIPKSLPSIQKDVLYKNNILSLLILVLSLPTVGSKRFITNKVDRSVTGLIAQQQCVGQLHTPLSNYSITAQSHFGLTGCVTAIGEQPIKSLINPSKMARMALGEMLTNMVFAKITNIADIRFSANWMWPLNFEGEKSNLYDACESMCNMARELNIASDRGKDSLSMSYRDHNNNKTTKCPSSLVCTGYAPTNDIRIKVTPDFKKYGSRIYYITFNGKFRLGASSMAYVLNQIGNDNDCPDVDDIKSLKEIFTIIQKLISEGKILAGHDVSDGGIVTTLCEMAFAGDMGFRIKLPIHIFPYYFLFSEELGLVIEVDEAIGSEIETLFGEHSYFLGYTINEDVIDIVRLFSEKMTTLRSHWESNSHQMENLQRTPQCVEEEYNDYLIRHQSIPHKNFKQMKPMLDLPIITKKHKVAIIRDEGTNGDRELASAFYMAGFDVYDLCINDFIIDPSLTLDQFRGIAFAGGFSYSDVCGAGQGWANVIKNNTRINDVFNAFKNRTNTFSLGVCNGCQLMSLLEWIPGYKMITNQSNKFESRCPFVKINKSNSIMLQGMENLMLPVWVAHGEGQFVLDNMDANISIQYIDDLGNSTIRYPYNPNGSNNGVAAVCSDNGRHLATMPHPERAFLNWQIPYCTDNDELHSPWLLMFINAYKWCEEN